MQLQQRAPSLQRQQCSSSGVARSCRSRSCSSRNTRRASSTSTRALSSSSSDGGGRPDVSFEEAFAAEVATRQAVEARQAEVEAAATFDGRQLLQLLRSKYSRSYDVSLVSRPYMGRTFVALNVMWRYAEQASWKYTPTEYLQRLDYVAAALVAWGAVTRVQTQLAATKERPRVGKAVSIMLDVPAEVAREWIAL